MDVFGDCLGLESTDFFQRQTSEEATATSEEGTVMGISPSLQ
jgi:hypothetical protein